MTFKRGMDCIPPCLPWLSPFVAGLLTPARTLHVGDHNCALRMHEYFEVGCVISPNSIRGHNVSRWQSAMKEEEEK